MDFSLTEEQAMLKSQAREFFQRELPDKATQRAILEDEKGYSPKMWRDMAALGWQSLYFPEEYGGAGGSFMDVVILLEEMSRALLPNPFFSPVILGGLFILEAGSEEQKRNFVPQIASGDKLFTLAFTEPGGGYQASDISTKAVEDKDGYLINGVKLFVPDAAIADYLICVARTSDKALPESGITIFIVDAKSPGITYTELKTIAKDRQYEVVFEGVPVPKVNMLGKLDHGWDVVMKVLPKVYVAQCAQMVGGIDRVLEMTVNYVKETEQGGRLLGSFQSIRHVCADMLIALDSSRFLTYEAAWKIDQGLLFEMEASMAQAWVSDAYYQTCVSGQQLQGGFGYVDDPDMGLFTRRAKMLEVTFGDAEFHREKVAQKLGL